MDRYYWYKNKSSRRKGVNGASAYELWVNDVKNDKIKDKNNSAWSKDKITMADFTLTSVEQMATMENPLMNYGKRL